MIYVAQASAAADLCGFCDFCRGGYSDYATYKTAQARVGVLLNFLCKSFTR